MPVVGVAGIRAVRGHIVCLDADGVDRCHAGHNNHLDLLKFAVHELVEGDLVVLLQVVLGAGTLDVVHVSVFSFGILLHVVPFDVVAVLGAAVRFVELAADFHLVALVGGKGTGQHHARVLLDAQIEVDVVVVVHDVVGVIDLDLLVGARQVGDEVLQHACVIQRVVVEAHRVNVEDAAFGFQLRDRLAGCEAVGAVRNSGRHFSVHVDADQLLCGSVLLGVVAVLLDNKCQAHLALGRRVRNVRDGVLVEDVSFVVLLDAHCIGQNVRSRREDLHADSAVFVVKRHDALAFIRYLLGSEGDLEGSPCSCRTACELDVLVLIVFPRGSEKRQVNLRGSAAADSQYRVAVFVAYPAIASVVETGKGALDGRLHVVLAGVRCR